ncbi:transporter substrate-binding domain-containing protein [Streptomyces sp. NPDC001404]|uniref:transporter substrate-binding domain-containing protein n=1 Tax=Streptomyces sp. NPDC001404 TaxID=3364571 RepID=UPI0036870586
MLAFRGFRRIVSTALACSAVLLAASGATTPAHAGPPAALKVCTTGDYKPLTFRDAATGEYSGIDIDMARDLAAHLGRRAQFVPTTWPTLMNDLAVQGKCDIAMGGVSITAERREQADFTDPYLTDGKVPLVRSEDVDRYRTLDQINRKDVRVIVNPGGTNEKFVREHLPDATVTVWKDNATVFDEIAAGRADVMITDALEARYQSGQHPGLAPVHPDRPFTVVEKAYMLPKNSPLTEQADDWLATAVSDGTFQAYYDRWMASSRTERTAVAAESSAVVSAKR